jgi:hypothetical protein
LGVEAISSKRGGASCAATGRQCRAAVWAKRL